jgi:hypothetical protein
MGGLSGGEQLPSWWYRACLEGSMPEMAHAELLPGERPHRFLAQPTWPVVSRSAWPQNPPTCRQEKGGTR